jgi:antitoxin ParD1/3/4
MAASNNRSTVVPRRFVLKQHWHILPIQPRLATERKPKDSPMPTRNVVLTPHHETVIDTLVKSGRYQNASEVLREGLRLIEQHEAQEAAKLQALQEAARIGLTDLDAGRYRDIHDDELEEAIAQLGRRASVQVNASGG